MGTDKTWSDLSAEEQIAERYRRAVDSGARVELSPGELLGAFGHTHDTPEARESVADALWEAGLRTQPALPTAVGMVLLIRAEEQPSKGEAGPRGVTEYRVNPVGVVLVVVGGAMLALSSFLPLDEPSGAFRLVEKNTLIEHGEWWLLAIGAILVVAALSSSYSRRRPGWSVFILAVIAAGLVVYLAQDKGLRTLYPLNTSGEAEPSGQGTVVPLGIAIYVAGAGAALSVIGAWVMRRTVEAAPVGPAQVTKQCPDCAETVLAEANVCKHCGYRFAPPSAGQPEAPLPADP
jgi:hypothetical protein